MITKSIIIANQEYQFDFYDTKKAHDFWDT